ncbi:MAG: alpha/beta hydrolase [Chitinophagaceae bacterium]
MNAVLHRNNVTVRGNGSQTLIFAHGFGCSQYTWQEVASAFEKEYRVVLFDYVGAGQSDLTAYDSKKYSTLDGYAQDILDICEVLDLKDTVLIGHSVSCMIAVIAGIKKPEYFKSLVFVSPSPYFFTDASYDGGLNREDVDGLFTMMESNYLGWSSMMAPLIMGNPQRPELGDALAASFCSTDPKIAKEFAKVTFYSDNRSFLPLLKVKSLTLQCLDDMLAPPRIATYINEHTPGNTQVNLEATGHCPHLSAPVKTIAAIRDYLVNPEIYEDRDLLALKQ